MQPISTHGHSSQANSMQFRQTKSIHYANMFNPKKQRKEDFMSL